MNALMKIETLPCHKLRNPIGENIPIYRMQLGFSIGNKTRTKQKGLYLYFLMREINHFIWRGKLANLKLAKHIILIFFPIK